MAEVPHGTGSRRRVVSTGRGGYCFHLNGAFAVLLVELGYAVRWHRGILCRRSQAAPGNPRVNHLALTVHDLPSPANPGGEWLVDVGLGDALHEPVPLRAGEVVQGPFRYQVGHSPVLAGGWRFSHDEAGSFAWVDIEERVAIAADFASSHDILSTSPTSGFVRWISAQRRDATGVDRLVSATLRRSSGRDESQRVLTSAREWFDVLADVFSLTLDDVGARAREELWRRAQTAQQEWDAQSAVPVAHGVAVAGG